MRCGFQSVFPKKCNTAWIINCLSYTKRRTYSHFWE